MNDQNKCCFSNGANKGDFLKLISILIIITSVFMVFKTIGIYRSNKFIGTGVVGSTMSFEGQGEVFAKADIATISYTATEEAKTPAKAQEMVAEKVNKSIEFLKKSGIEEKDIKTEGYNVYPRYEWQKSVACTSSYCPPEGTRVLMGYEASQTVSVKIREVEKSGAILTGIGAIGFSNISGVEFSIDDEDTLKREARKLAIEKAKTKAEELSKDLGVKLVRIVSFSESAPYPYYARMEKASTLMDSGMGIGGGAITPEIPVGENKITSNVVITYEIR